MTNNLKPAIAVIVLVCIGTIVHMQSETARPDSSGTIPCAYPKSLGRVITLFTFGQSNAADSVFGDKYKTNKNVFAFDWAAEKCLRAQNPLPNQDGTEGGPWVRLGEKLIEANLTDAVVILAAAISGSYISEWEPSGRNFPHLKTALMHAVDANLVPSYLLWHQGEAEANNTQMSKEEYMNRFHNMLSGIRALGIDAPIFVPRATLCETWPYQTSPSPHFDNRGTIRAAQAALVDPARGILAGPDTDVIGINERNAGCHFDIEGNKRHVSLWFTALALAINRRALN